VNLTFTKENHQYQLDGAVIPGFSEIISRSGISDTRWYTEDARAFGSNAHRTVELHIAKRLKYDTLHDELKRVVAAYDEFAKMFKFVPLHIEQPMFSPLYRIASTPDLIGTSLGSDITVFEMKFGAKACWHALQTATHQGIYNELSGRADCFFNGKALAIKGKIKKRYSLYYANGKFKAVEHVLPSDYSVFLGYVQTQKWENNNNILVRKELDHARTITGLSTGSNDGRSAVSDESVERA